MNIDFPPASWMRWTVSSPPFSSTSAMTTVVPCWAKARAEDRPIPELPPVMRATLFFSWVVIIRVVL